MNLGFTALKFPLICKSFISMLKGKIKNGEGGLSINFRHLYTVIGILVSFQAGEDNSQ
jgi:hypothetical protein